MQAIASACPACGHGIKRISKISAVLLNFNATCGSCGTKCGINKWLSSGVAIFQIALIALSVIEYAKHRGKIFLVVFSLFTAVSMYLLVKFAPLKKLD